MIREIEGFASQLDCLAFPNLEGSRQGQIDLKNTGAHKRVLAQAAVRPEGWIGKRRPVDPVISRLLSGVWVAENLIRTLFADFRAIEGAIDACSNRKEASRPHLHNGRELPIAGNYL